MKPTNAFRKTRRLKELSENAERLIARSQVSLADQREVLERVIEKNDGIKLALASIRNKN